MMDFALVGKWPGCGASGLIPSLLATDSAALRSPAWSSEDTSASRPIPEPVRRRKSRREVNSGEGVAMKCDWRFIASFNVNEFIQSEKRLAKIGQRQLRRVLLPGGPIGGGLGC